MLQQQSLQVYRRISSYIVVATQRQQDFFIQQRTFPLIRKLWYNNNSTSSRSHSNVPSRERKRRFYREVNIQPCLPPWENDMNKSSNSTVSSGITAGVDGTDVGASGVILSNNIDQDRMMKTLIPRKPGISYNDEDNNNAKDQQQWYCITLDGRTLRTPLGKILAVPSILFAHMIASEWNSISYRGGSGSNDDSSINNNTSSHEENVVTYNQYIIPSQMPFMTIACTAIDQTSNQMDTYRKYCISYLHTDTICYWSDPIDDRVLYTKQQLVWNHIHTYFKNDFCGGHEPSVAIGPMEGILIIKNGMKGLGHPKQLINFCENWLHTLDAWQLTALYNICADSKSFIISTALLMSNYQDHNTNTNNFTVNQALEAARVEEEFNIENWGLVEGGHDYDRLNSSIQITSSLLVSSYLTHDTIILK